MTIGQVAGAQRIFSKRLFNHPFWRETGSTTAVTIKIGLKQMANVEMTCILCAAEKPETVQSTRARLPAMSCTYFVLISIISCSGAEKNIPATSSPHPHNIPTTRYYQQLLFAESMAWSAAPSLADVRSHRRSRPGRRRLQSGLDLGIRTSTRSSYKVVSCGFTRIYTTFSHKKTMQHLRSRTSHRTAF